MSMVEQKIDFGNEIRNIFIYKYKFLIITMSTNRVQHTEKLIN